MAHHASNPAYETVAAAIRFVRSHAGAQPSLDEVARHVGLSASHLQRLFSDWAGISPKRFLQFLTKEHAKTLLRESRDVMSAALEAGLSGPGRLHDLMVQCEALTPGEIGSRGEGLMIHYGFADSPFGRLIIGNTARGVCHLRFVEAKQTPAEEAALHAEWPLAQFARNDAIAQQFVAGLFAPFAAPRPLRLLLRGTNFQIKVWEALLTIPAGRVLCYRDVASRIVSPNAQRTVGSALAKNTIAVLIPCHRVIRESGDVGMYRWGAERKHSLIIWEQSRPEAVSGDE